MSDSLILSSNGIRKLPYIDRYIHLSSGDRDITIWPDSAACQLDLQEINGLFQIEMTHFEIANPRNTIESGSNHKLVFAEYDGSSTYRVFVANLPEGTYSISDIGAAMTAAMNYAHSMTDYTAVHNTYNVVADGVASHLHIHTATTTGTPRTFQLHLAGGTYTDTTNMTPATDRLTFSAANSPRNLWLPGHLVTIRTTQGTVTAQIASWVDDTTVQFNTNDLNTPWSAYTFAQLSPVHVSSAHHTSAALLPMLGFDEEDVTCGSAVGIINIQNPTAVTVASPASTSVVEFVVGTEFQIQANVAGRYVKLTNTDTFLDDEILEVVTGVDNFVHVQLSVDLQTTLWGSGLTLDDGTSTDTVANTDVTLESITAGVMRINVVTDGTLNTGVSTIDVTGWSGYTPAITCDVVAWVTNTVTLDLTFPFSVTVSLPIDTTTTYPTAQLVSSGGVLLHLIAQNSYDLTLLRRVIFIELRLNGSNTQQLGALYIPGLDQNTYFARVQLDSGTLNVQFISGERLIGKYDLPVLQNKVNSVYLRLLTEDGIQYPLNGSNFSITLRCRSTK